MGYGIGRGNFDIGFRCAASDCPPFQILPQRPALRDTDYTNCHEFPGLNPWKSVQSVSLLFYDILTNDLIS